MRTEWIKEHLETEYQNDLELLEMISSLMKTNRKTWEICEAEG